MNIKEVYYIYFSEPRTCLFNNTDYEVSLFPCYFINIIIRINAMLSHTRGFSVYNKNGFKHAFKKTKGKFSSVHSSYRKRSTRVGLKEAVLSIIIQPAVYLRTEVPQGPTRWRRHIVQHWFQGTEFSCNYNQKDQMAKLPAIKQATSRAPPTQGLSLYRAGSGLLSPHLGQGFTFYKRLCETKNVQWFPNWY